MITYISLGITASFFIPPFSLVGGKRVNYHGDSEFLPHRDSEVFRCPTLETRRKTSFSICKLCCEISLRFAPFHFFFCRVGIH